MKMKKYEIKIKGWKNNELIWNRMKRELQEEIKKLKKNELAEWEEENWIRKAETDGDGNLIMPTSWPISMLINSAKQTGMPPDFETSKKKTYTRYIQGVMQMVQKPLIIVGKVKDVEKIDGYYRNPNTGGKVWKIFPALKNWEATFTIVDAQGRMLIRELKELLDYGGQFVGVGDQRNKGYGRFDVEYVREVK